MARVYSGKKGKHGSKKPAFSSAKKWTKLKKKEVEDVIISLAKERKNSAVIGLILRDKYGVPDVKVSVGKSIGQILKENNIYPELPEDMMSMLNKAVLLHEHLERHKPDKHSKKGLENLESKIRRLGKYYVRKGRLPAGWRYSYEDAKLIVQK